MSSFNAFESNDGKETQWTSTQTEPTPTTSSTPPEQPVNQFAAPVSNPAPTVSTAVPSTPGTAQPVAPATVTETATPAPGQQVPSDPRQAAIDALMSGVTDLGNHTAPFKLLVYGDSGTGKSSFLGGIDNSLTMDLEDGMVAAKSSPLGFSPTAKVRPWTDFDDMKKFIYLFANKEPAVEHIKVLNIDTISDLHKRWKEEVTVASGRMNQFVAVTEDYVEINERMIRFVRDLRNLPVGIVLTSHAKTVEPKNKIPSTYLDFSESLSNAVMAMMDVVTYVSWMDVGGEAKLVARFRPSVDGIRAKARAGFPEFMVDPTYEKILKLWEESQNKV